MKEEDLNESVVILDPQTSADSSSSFISSNDSISALNDEQLLQEIFLDDSIAQIGGFDSPQLSIEEKSEDQKVPQVLPPVSVKEEVEVIFDLVEEKVKDLEKVLKTSLETDRVASQCSEERRVPSLDISDLILGAENDSEDYSGDEDTLMEFLPQKEDFGKQEESQRKRKPESEEAENTDDIPSNEQFVKPSLQVGESLYVDCSRKV